MWSCFTTYVQLMLSKKITFIGHCNFGFTRDTKLGPMRGVLKLLHTSGIDTGGNISQRVLCKLHRCTRNSIEIGPLSVSVTSKLPFIETMLDLELAVQLYK